MPRDPQRAGELTATIGRMLESTQASARYLYTVTEVTRNLYLGVELNGSSIAPDQLPGEVQELVDLLTFTVDRAREPAA